MNFVTIDVETANTDVGSICQIGMAKYIKGKLIDTYYSFVLPQTNFSRTNIEIHGIDSNTVKDAPTIFDIYGKILQFVGNNVVVSYTDFDKRAIYKCLSDHNLPLPQWQWVDASIMVRHTCQRFSKKGYNLANVCNEWNYQFNHHDALEDAKACGYIVTTILRENSLSIIDWLPDGDYVKSLSNKSIKSRFPINRPMEGNENGRFYGLNICFTGELSIKRAEIAEIAAKHGFTVKAGASKKLHYLVVGTPDISLLNGHDKSSKQRKVEELIESGADIKVIEEYEFLKLLNIQ
ncbi:exonuclease domain-containing protein [Psychrobacter sanguinis]|uniref:exonuclease domain-containing protein n=1 Tax=Psychrobacter sanguinis TaxID=861445 RepID=UPI002A7553EC|nr:exonuclease domain-containing protein [Psychrobacter sanguinis]MDY3306674.1 exonuclease domain-containing protein [Psychrobacter sanguinis]